MENETRKDARALSGGPGYYRRHEDVISACFVDLQTKNQQKYGNECETPKEHDEFQALANCPFHEEVNAEYGETAGCAWAESSAKEVFTSKKEREALEQEGRVDMPSEFTAGKVTVKLAQPIVLKGGFAENEAGDFQWLGARGAATIAPVAQAAPSLTKDVDSSLLSPPELERYDYYVHTAKQLKTTATVELAGSPRNLYLNEENLLDTEGEAFGFPVKVKLSNPFVGEDCYVGSDEHAIVVPFTTGTSGELKGKLGTVQTNAVGSLLTIYNDTLVSSGFEAPGVEGCGVEGGADNAMNEALGLPSATGNVAVIDGSLKQAGAELAEATLAGNE